MKPAFQEAGASVGIINGGSQLSGPYIPQSDSGRGPRERLEKKAPFEAADEVCGRKVSFCSPSWALVVECLLSYHYILRLYRDREVCYQVINIYGLYNSIVALCNYFLYY